MSLQYQNILIERKENVGIIYLNRPRVLNALNRNTVDEIMNAMKDFNNDENVRVIIITGNGDNFSAGADIKEMSQLSSIDARGKKPIS